MSFDYEVISEVRESIITIVLSFFFSKNNIELSFSNKLICLGAINTLVVTTLTLMIIHAEHQIPS